MNSGIEVVATQRDLKAALADALRANASIGFVPTMGALHEGHMSLVHRAREENDVVAASIFVNPLQFDDKGDLDRYPRTIEADVRGLEAAGCNVVLTGAVDDFYPDGFATTVQVTRVTDGGEGGERPGHFDGVTTVVMKLFGMFEPTRAYFGWKDMQQCCVIRRMVLDLSSPVEVVPCEIVREPDGLACSSRNRLLTEAERGVAPRFHAALTAAREAFARGERQTAALQKLVRERLEDDFVVDYVEIRDELDYGIVRDPVPGGRIVAAVRLGKVRLLDNIPLGGRR